MDGWQATVVLLAVIGTIIWITWLVLNKNKWKYSVLPLTYFANVLLYNAFVVFGTLPSETLLTWTHIVRLHSIFLFTGLGYLFLFKPDVIRNMVNGNGKK